MQAAFFLQNMLFGLCLEHDEDEPEILELELAALTAHWRWHGVKGFLVELHYNLYMY